MFDRNHSPGKKKSFYPPLIGIIHRSDRKSSPPCFGWPFFLPPAGQIATKVCLCWDSVLVLFALGHFCVGLLIFCRFASVFRSSGKNILRWFMEKDLDLMCAFTILCFEFLISSSVVAEIEFYLKIQTLTAQWIFLFAILRWTQDTYRMLPSFGAAVKFGFDRLNADDTTSASIQICFGEGVQDSELS